MQDFAGMATGMKGEQCCMPLRLLLSAMCPAEPGILPASSMGGGAQVLLKDTSPGVPTNGPQRPYVPIKEEAV